jgi:hypothetical protein
VAPPTAAATLLALVLVAGGGAGTPARACNACREDRVAASYDWQVVERARQRGHVVVFTAIRGAVRPGDVAITAAIERAVGSAAGVDAGTVRVSLAPPATSFACDPRRRSPQRLLAEVNRRLLPRRLALELVQVGASSAPARLSASR